MNNKFNKNISLFNKVYEIVKRIPSGKVATYGQISLLVAERLKNLKTKKQIIPRVVGFALHANKDPKVPCHRVVDRNGRLAPNFGFRLPSINRSSRPAGRVREVRLRGGGWREQKKRLLQEGVTFVDKMHINLDKHIWKGGEEY